MTQGAGPESTTPADRCLTKRWALLALFAAGTAVAVPAPAHGQQGGPDEATQVRRVRAVRVPQGAITVDGRLEEREWGAVAPADAFLQQQPQEGTVSTHASEVRFLYDDTYLYVGARLAEDELDRLVVNELRRDFNARDGDLFVVVLDTFNDKLNAYSFQTNPGCAIRDTQSYDDGRTINANWDGVWFCRASRDESGWYVEQAIPFKQLRFPTQDEQLWGLQIFRLIRHSNEQTIWNPTPRQFNQFKTSYAGLLEGISGVRPGRNIRIKPFVTGSASQRAGVSDRTGDGGFDAKVGLGTNFVLDGTYRTDFSQVEADTQQINLTRFSLFFPERREFFLENQGAFQIGPPATGASNLIPFFSRTIGLADGAPVPIVAGGRLTGKAGRNSIAVLNIQVDDDERSGGRIPASNASVARYSREFLTNSSIGGFVLGKDAGATSNWVAGGDLRWYPTRLVNVDAMLLHSEKTGIGGGNAWRAGAQYDSTLTQYAASFTSLDASFKDDLGFIPREGVDIVDASVMRRVRPRALEAFVREIRPQLAYARYSRPDVRDAVGQPLGVETETWTPGVEIGFSDGSALDVTIAGNEEALIAPFRPQGIPAGESIPAGRYTFTSGSVSFSGSNARRVAPTAAWRSGGYYNGERDGVTLGARVRVSEKLATTVSVARDVVTLPGAVEFSTVLASLRVDASFSTRMFLNAFVQYNSVTKQVSSNIRYNFIHRPLSDLYIVVNDTRGSGTSLTGPALPESRAVILKLTHLLSF